MGRRSSESVKRASISFPSGTACLAWGDQVVCPSRSPLACFALKRRGWVGGGVGVVVREIIMAPRCGRTLSMCTGWGNLRQTVLFDLTVLCSCDRFCLHGPFNCISFHKFSRLLSVFLLSSAGLISTLLVLSTLMFLYESLLQP